MKRLFDSVAFEESTYSGSGKPQTDRITYEFRESEGVKPYVRITFFMKLADGGRSDVELDIPRDDMVDLLNEVVDEWPDIVDCRPAKVKRGVHVIPTFC